MFDTATGSPKPIIVVQDVFLRYTQGTIYLIPHVMIAEEQAKREFKLIE